MNGIVASEKALQIAVQNLGRFYLKISFSQEPETSLEASSASKL